MSWFWRTKLCFLMCPSSFNPPARFLHLFFPTLFVDSLDSVVVLAEWRALSNDVFVLPTFLLLEDQPRFLLYLVSSRLIDVVLLSNSELAYFVAPLLRRCVRWCCFYVWFTLSSVRLVDFVHHPEEEWKSGGHCRHSVTYDSFLHHTLAASSFARNWMVERGKVKKFESLSTSCVLAGY